MTFGFVFKKIIELAWFGFSFDIEQIKWFAFGFVSKCDLVWFSTEPNRVRFFALSFSIKAPLIHPPKLHRVHISEASLFPAFSSSKHIIYFSTNNNLRSRQSICTQEYSHLKKPSQWSRIEKIWNSVNLSIVIVLFCKALSRS